MRQALRTLQLLEQHHKKLAQILRFQHEHPASTAGTEPSAPAQAQAVSQAQTPDPTAAPKTPTAAPDTQPQPPRLTGHGRSLQREASSLASNLASARGIPSHPRRGTPASPTLSSQHAGAKMAEAQRTRTGDARLRDAHSQGGGRERSGRVSAPKQPWSPPQISPTEITSQQIVPPDAGEEPPRQRGRLPTDDPFQRFYSTFEGLISKLSAPLAFAGLPLGSDVSTQPDPGRQKSAADTKVDRYNAVPDRSSISTEPDVNKIFSRAALRAIRDTNGGGTPGSTAESFYVVPTTGGTVSYAGILSRAEREARRNSSVEDGDEDFVDARETPSSPEMLHTFSSGAKGNNKAGRGAAAKTMEELQMENEALRHLSDNLSKRLHMWEVNAQSSSMALQQSLKAMQHQNAAASPRQHSPAASTSPASPAPANAEQRIKELEELVRQSQKELERVGRENEKLKTVLGRYRERWEKLKEGAKTRRSGEASSSSSSNPAANGGAGAAAAATLTAAAAATATAKKPDGISASPVPAPAPTPSPAPTSAPASTSESASAAAKDEGETKGERDGGDQVAG